MSLSQALNQFAQNLGRYLVAFADGKCAVIIDMLLTFPKNFVC